MNTKITHYEFTENAKTLQNLYFELLEFDLKDSKNIGHPFYDDYQKLLTVSNNPNQYNYLLTYNLFHPIEIFEKIKSKSTVEFNYFKNRLLKNNKNIGFYGDKFELFIAFSLLERDIKYTKPEPPDFKIKFDNSEIYIECGTAQFDVDSKRSKVEIFSKLRKNINAKLKKKYSNDDTILFLDITNLIYHSEKLKEPLTDDELKFTIDKVCQKGKSEQMFGLIVLFHFFSSQTSQYDRFFHWKPTLYTNNYTNLKLFNFVNSNLIDSKEGKILEFPKFH